MSERAFPSASWLFDAQLPISVDSVGDGYMRFVVPRRARGKGGERAGDVWGRNREGRGLLGGERGGGGGGGGRGRKRREDGRIGWGWEDGIPQPRRSHWPPSR